MSNPITANVEYFMNREHEQDKDRQPLAGDDGPDPQQEQPPFMTMEDHDDYDTTHLAKRWHSLMRRMSVTIQREAGTPEAAIRSGTPHQPTDHERQLMLAIPLPPPMDDHLPSIDEVAQENALAIKLAEMKPSYFEHPFEQVDSDSDNDEVPDDGVEAPSALGAEARPTQQGKYPLSKAVSTDLFSIFYTVGRPYGMKQTILNSFGSQRRSSTAPHMWTKYPLAPFYPPVYVVPHIAFFSRDEHGRRAVSNYLSNLPY